MPLIKPPDPVTISYIGQLSGYLGTVASVIKRVIPWRYSSWIAVLVGLGAAGYAGVVWLMALLGLLGRRRAYFLPDAPDAPAVGGAFLGLGWVAGAVWGLSHKDPEADQTALLWGIIVALLGTVGYRFVLGLDFGS